MSSHVEATRPSEAIALGAPRPRVAIEAMNGRWLPTNDTPQWIGALDVSTDGDALFVHVSGGGASPSPGDWGTKRADATYASALDTGDARSGAFVAEFDFPAMHVELQANLNLGLLVVATFITFRDGGRLPDRFTREFFRRAGTDEVRA